MSARLQKKKTWKELVDEQKEKDKLKGATCHIYSDKLENGVDKDTQCICGRLARRHSFIGNPKSNYRNAKKWNSKLAAVVDVTEYGQISNGARVSSWITQNMI